MDCDTPAVAYKPDVPTRAWPAARTDSVPPPWTADHATSLSPSNVSCSCAAAATQTSAPREPPEGGPHTKPSSTTHDALQPSPGTLLPSSHFSSPWRKPSLHRARERTAGATQPALVSPQSSEPVLPDGESSRTVPPVRGRSLFDAELNEYASTAPARAPMSAPMLAWGTATVHTRTSSRAPAKLRLECCRPLPTDTCARTPTAGCGATCTPAGRPSRYAVVRPPVATKATCTHREAGTASTDVT